MATRLQALFARPPEYPPHARSYVAHNMMVWKPYMLEMLKELDASDSALLLSSAQEPAALPTWALRILKSVRPGYRNVLVGFSEYTTYVSWVLQRHPESMAVVPSKEWGRITPRRKTREALYSDECCPSEVVIAQARAKTHWAYLGWELGHSGECSGTGESSARPHVLR